MVEVFFLFFLFVMYTILFFPFTLVVWFLNTLFSFYQSVQSLFILFLRGIRCLSCHSAVTLASGPYIPERLGLSFLTSISFGCYMLVLLSEKLTDEKDLDLFIVFTESYVSVL